MNILFNDVTILSALIEAISKSAVDIMGLKFHTIYTSLDQCQRAEAKELEEIGALKFVELEEKEEELEWMWRNYDGSVSLNEMAILRFAYLYDFTLLTNDPVLTAKAKSLGITVVDVNYLTEMMEDEVIADEDMSMTFLAHIFRHRPDHWRWFKSQHIKLGRIAAMF